ncbi:MAG: dihydrolipoyl dehydrogenase family protein [Thermodesulfobacteriota bacterium]
MNAWHTERYDLCVIGCGPGGFAAAMRALDFGKSVCILEAGEIGGAGVRWGALASKTMWELSKDYAVAAKMDRGYCTTALRVDFESMRSTVIQAVEERQSQMLTQLDRFSPHRWKGGGSLTLKRGHGRFLSRKILGVISETGREERVAADFFVIATGSRPRQIDGIQTDQERVLDSDGILNLKTFPKRLMIIGAGIIGCEYATIFANFGQTAVSLVDHMDRVIPYEDDDVSDFVRTSLTRDGVRIHHSSRLREVIRHDSHLQAVLECSDGRRERFDTDALLIAIGRRPQVEQLGLEQAGIIEKKSSHLLTDVNCRLTDSIYAVGDVNHHPALINIAEGEGRLAVEHMFGKNPRPLNYRNMSTVMFFHPAVASVGLSERACRRQNIAYRAAYHDNHLLSRAIAMRTVRGFAKIIVSDDARQTILGMRAAGPQVSSMIMAVALLMDQNIGIRDMLKTVYPHPTISEGIQECLRLLLGESVYKPEAFPEYLKLWSWHPGEPASASP